MVIRLGAQIRFIARVVKCSNSNREGRRMGCEGEDSETDREVGVPFLLSKHLGAALKVGEQ